MRILERKQELTKETATEKAKAASATLSFGVGLNWHLNRNIKLSLDYGHTDFSAAAGNPYDVQSEDIFLTRAQFSF